MKREWWKDGVVYQIYPRSFQDSNGDGVGDLPGITSRLDHILDIGAKAIWISPVYPSPMADFGYDVANYTDIDPMFGTLENFDLLVQEAHSRGLKVLLDFVPNHTSDQHAWFQESRSSLNNPKRDWYIWHDPAADGGPPNNWLSHFGGSAWEWDKQTNQYYLHSFLKEQPDVNWRNPDLKNAMHDSLRFWMARGVDGFRVDVMWLMIKDDQFRDNPEDPNWREGAAGVHKHLHLYDADRPEVQDVVHGLRCVLDEYPERVMIGEIYLPFKELIAYHGTEEKPGAHMPFNFSLILSDWSAKSIASLVRDYEAALPAGAWPNYVLGNHDQPRIATRAGVDQARVAAMLLLTLRGTPTIYYGDELGMQNIEVPPELVQDPAELREPGVGRGRDGERSPMQWNDESHAGFTTGKPWLPVAPNYATINVAKQKDDPASLLSLYRKLIAVRSSDSTLLEGAIENIRTYGDSVLGYDRVSADRPAQLLTVLLNMSDNPQHVPDMEGQTILATQPGLSFDADHIIPANAGFILARENPLSQPRKRNLALE